MNKIDTFLLILAWPVGIINTLLVVVRLITAANYSDLDRLHDQCKGQERTFPIILSSFIALACWAWILI
jgi:hypothetical protein